VYIGLADEQGFPHQGFTDFVDNQIDRGTGTIVGRAVIPNADGLLAPGLFVRLRLIGSGEYHAILIPDAAVMSDQAEKFVWVVDDSSHVRYRRVKIGTLHDGFRVVTEGLTRDDRVVVHGVQRARPDVLVDAQEEDLSQQAPASPPSMAPPAPRAADG